MPLAGKNLLLIESDIIHPTCVSCIIKFVSDAFTWPTHSSCQNNSASIKRSILLERLNAGSASFVLWYINMISIDYS